MPGRIHQHTVKVGGKTKKILLYHRVDGAWLIHGVNHSAYSRSIDRSIDAKTKQTKDGVGRQKRRKGYGHTGDKKGRRI